MKQADFESSCIPIDPMLLLVTRNMDVSQVVRGLPNFADHLNSTAHESVFQRKDATKVTYTISNRELNIATVPNVSLMCTLSCVM